MGHEEAYIGARIEHQGLEQVYELTLSPRGRKVRLDGKAVRPISRYFGGFNVILFAPEDLQVPRGSPGGRRRFLDRTVFGWEPAHLAVAQQYDKVLRSRNAVLKDMASGRSANSDMLAVFDQSLAEAGASLRRARVEFLTLMAPRFQAAYEAITQSGMEAAVTYQMETADGPRPAVEFESSEFAQQLAADLSASASRDRARQSTSAGPHRDDLLFTLSEQPAQSFASQGQLRAMILAWKTAEMDLLNERGQGSPILLLDDVSSELDRARNEYLFEFLRQRDNQCFITTTHPNHVLLERERRDYSVNAGCVIPVT